jgi:hypothetical protein
MDSTWFEIIVIILSVFLALFLGLAIFLLVKIIQIIKMVKRITEHAEQVADRAEHISAFFEKTATPVALVKLVTNFSDIFQKKRGKK